MITRLIPIVILIIPLSMFFSGCGSCPEPLPPKKIFVSGKCPKLRVLYLVPKYSLSYAEKYDENRTLVLTKELEAASKACQDVRRRRRFERNQIIHYNKEFTKNV